MRSSARMAPVRPGTIIGSAGATPSTISNAWRAARSRSGSSPNCATESTASKKIRVRPPACPLPSRSSRRSAASPVGMARALLAPEEWRICHAPGAPPSPRTRLTCAHIFWAGCGILTHPLIGCCDCSALCDPLGADRYMLRRGSAWTGWGWASSGMPGWKRGALFLQRMVERSTVRLRQLACHRAEEVKFGRFLRNDRVSVEALNRGAGERVGRLAQGCHHVLAIQDTTELNFQRHAGRTHGLGPVGNGTDQGLFLHPLLAIEADGERCLGLAWAKLWVRRGKIQTARRQRPIGQKESQRWQDAIAAAERVLGAAELVTVVSDREADIYESWARPRPANLHLLARAAQNR